MKKKHQSNYNFVPIILQGKFMSQYFVLGTFFFFESTDNLRKLYSHFNTKLIIGNMYIYLFNS